MSFDSTSRAEAEGLHERLGEVRALLRADFGLIVKRDPATDHHVVLASAGEHYRELPIVGEPVMIKPDPRDRGTSQSLRNVVIKSDVRSLALVLPTAITVQLGRDDVSELVIFGSHVARASAEQVLQRIEVRALHDAVRLQQTATALVRERSLTEALQRIFDRQTTTLGLSDVVDVLLTSVRRLLGSDVAYFAMPEAGRADTFSFTNFINIETVPFRMLRMDAGKGLGGLAREELMTIRSMNYAEDIRLREPPVAETQGEGILSAMSSPIITDGGVAGLIYVGNRHFTPFADADVELLERFSAAASSVVEQHLGDEYRLEAIRQREREQIAYRLHDTVIRSLVEVGIHVDEARGGEQDPAIVEHLDHAGRAANEALTRLRNHLADLVEEPYVDGVMTIREIWSSLNGRRLSGSCRLDIEGAGPGGTLPTSVAQALIRIGQEAISNADIHSGCTLQRVTIDIRESEVIMRVTDNGTFPNAEQILRAPAERGHLGLRAMRAVSDRVDGVIAIDHKPGRGTVVQARIPMPWRPGSAHGCADQ